MVAAKRGGESDRLLIIYYVLVTVPSSVHVASFNPRARPMDAASILHPEI